MINPLEELSARGVSIWLDDLSRRRLVTGSLAGLVARDHVVGVTTNPTIFAKAIADGDEEYAGQLRDLWARGTGVEEALRALTTHDVRGACDVLRPVYDATGGVDGRVSIEVDPRLAYDTDATIAEARYVTDLVAPGVINTMPEATLRAVADHGRIPADSVRGHYQDAREVLSQLRALGVDYDDVTATLEKQGLESFDASWRQLGDQLAAALRSGQESRDHSGEESGR